MNHFFALSLSDGIRRQIGERATAWATSMPPAFAARWYAPEDYHITLKFLGDIKETQQEKLIRAAASVAAQGSPVRVVTTRRFGAFPNKRLPRVLWAGVVPDPSLVALAGQLEEILETLGFEREGRAYSPHITLARCRPAPDKTLLSVPPSDDGWEQTEFVADGFHLMQTLPSQKDQSGPHIRYNIVHTFPLGEKQQHA